MSLSNVQDVYHAALVFTSDRSSLMPHLFRHSDELSKNTHFVNKAGSSPTGGDEPFGAVLHRQVQEDPGGEGACAARSGRGDGSTGRNGLETCREEANESTEYFPFPPPMRPGERSCMEEGVSPLRDC